MLLPFIDFGGLGAILKMHWLVFPDLYIMMPTEKMAWDLTDDKSTLVQVTIQMK